MKSHRVTFSFDERALESLRTLTKQGGFKSMGTALRESLSVMRVLQSQAAQGFTEIIVRNEETGTERMIIVPSLYGRNAV